MPHLEFDRQKRPLGPGVLTIGSAPEAGWRIIDHDLAPIHAMITMERDGHAHLSRATGIAPIYVNGQELLESERTLEAGDAIRLGEATLVLGGAERQDGVRFPAYVRDLSRGRAYRIDDRVEIGRDFACQVHLGDPDVSRIHCELVREGEGVMVKPRGGVVFRNGTRVTESTWLREGDELSIGRTMFRFTRETPVSAAVVAPVAPQDRRAGHHDSRLSRAPTAFMGVVQMREQLAKNQRRKVGRYVKIALAAGGLALGAWTLWHGTGVDPRAALVREAMKKDGAKR